SYYQLYYILYLLVFLLIFFFFQAEDGIRDRNVTGVQTCALPILLIGCCVGPIVLMGIVYDPAYRGPIDAGDLGKCVSIFHVLAIVFAGTHTATEINAGSTALSFLTQKSRWASLAAQAAVQW